MRNVFQNLPTVAILVAVFLLAPFSTAFSKEVSLMTKEEFKPIMNDADVVILDVRSGRDWSSSEFKIQGAVYADPKKVAEWEGTYSKDKRFVLYCA